MIRPLPFITFIRQFFKLPNNLQKVLLTNISDGIPCLFYFCGLNLALKPREVINPFPDLSNFFWLWRCDFHLVQIVKFQRDVQGDILVTTLDLSMFPNITMTAMFHVYSCELTKCELLLPESLPSRATIINRRWCYNC